MSYFPSWIRKTIWVKSSPQVRQNMLQATSAVMEMSLGGGAVTASSMMAMARGLPEKPAWLKGEIPADGRRDLVFLAQRVRRALKREAEKERQRAALMAKQQKSCTHTWELIPGGNAQYCNLCKLTEFRS